MLCKMKKALCVSIAQNSKVIFSTTFYKPKKDLFDWKAYILRSENQDQANNDVLSLLGDTTALVTMD